MSGKARVEQPKKKQEQPKQKQGQEKPKQKQPGQEQPKKQKQEAVQETAPEVAPEQPKQEQPKKKTQEQPKKQQGQEQPKEQPKKQQQGQEQPKKKQPGQEQPKEQPKKQQQQGQEQPKKKQQTKGQEAPKQEQAKKTQEQPKKQKQKAPKEEEDREVEIVTPGAQNANFSFNFDSSSFANDFQGTVLGGTGATSDFWKGKLDKNGDDEEAEEEDPIESFPLPQQRRIYALKALHTQYTELSDQFRAELRKLEDKYDKLYEPLYESRKQIVLGDLEATGEGIPEDKKEKFTALTQEQIKKEKGLPGFWLTVLKSTRAFSDMITPKDEEALNFLTDIRYRAEQEEDFSIDFFFRENPYFSNTVLTKGFQCKVERGELDIKKVTGTKINWKSPQKNLTVKLVKVNKGGKGAKRGRGGRGGAAGQTKTVEEPVDSFFTYFSSPEEQVLQLQQEVNEEMVSYMNSQEYEIASLLKDSLIPDAVLWFLGEKDDDEGDDDYDFGQDDDEDFDDEEDDEEDEEDDDEDEEDSRPRGGRGGKSGRGGKGGGKTVSVKSNKNISSGAPTTVEQPAECKNQ